MSDKKLSVIDKKLPATTEYTEELKAAIKEDYISNLKPLKKLAEEHNIPKGTLASWVQREGWNKEREKLSDLTIELAEPLKFILNPEVEEQAIIDYNLKMLIQIQAIQLARIKNDLMSGKEFTGNLSDSLQKYANALEKLQKTKQSADSDGVQRSEVTVKKVDYAELAKIYIEARQAGNRIDDRAHLEKVIELSNSGNKKDGN